MKLTRAMLDQLLSYLEVREREGWYYGNKKQFEDRHQKIRGWLQEEIDINLVTKLHKKVKA